MRQSTIIFGSLSAAFIIYITVRGQLEDYKALFNSSVAEVENDAEISSDGNVVKEKINSTVEANQFIDAFITGSRFMFPSLAIPTIEKGQ